MCVTIVITTTIFVIGATTMIIAMMLFIASRLLEKVELLVTKYRQIMCYGTK